MINVSKQSIVKAIRRDSPSMKGEAVEMLSEKIRNTTDPRLEKNVLEWIEGRKISDLWVGKYCINAIMSIRGDKDFIGALEAMNLYLSNEKEGTKKIWRMRS